METDSNKNNESKDDNIITRWDALRETTVAEKSRKAIFKEADELIVSIISDRDGEKAPEKRGTLLFILKWMEKHIQDCISEPKNFTMIQRMQSRETKQNVFLFQIMKTLLTISTWPTFQTRLNELMGILDIAINLYEASNRQKVLQGPIFQIVNTILSNTENNDTSFDNTLGLLKRLCDIKKGRALTTLILLTSMKRYQDLFKNPKIIGMVKSDIFFLVWNNRKTKNEEIFNNIFEIGEILIYEFRKHMPDEVEILLIEYYLPIMKENKCEKRKVKGIRFISTILQSFEIVEDLYYNYDRFFYSTFVFEKLLYELSKHHIKEIIEIYKIIIKALLDSKYLNLNIKKDLAMEEKIYRDNLVDEFNKSGIQGLNNLISSNVVKEAEKVMFLLETPAICKERIGELLSGKDVESANLRNDFFMLFNFKNESLVKCLRNVFDSLRITGESQRMELILEEFSRRFSECNGEESQEEQDKIFQLSYAVMILNTDLHNSSVKKKMKKETFISVYEGIAEETILSELYDEINEEEIVLENNKTDCYAWRRIRGMRDMVNLPNRKGNEARIYETPSGDEYRKGILDILTNCTLYFISGIFTSKNKEDVSDVIVEIPHDLSTILLRYQEEERIKSIIKITAEKSLEFFPGEEGVYSFKSIFMFANREDVVYSVETWNIILKAVSRLDRSQLRDPLIVPRFNYLQECMISESDIFGYNIVNLFWALCDSSFEEKCQILFLENFKSVVTSLPEESIVFLACNDILAPLGKMGNAKSKVVQVLGIEFLKMIVNLFSTRKCSNVLALSMALSEYALFYNNGREVFSLFRIISGKLLRTSKHSEDESGFIREIYPLITALTRIVIETKEFYIREETMRYLQEVVISYFGPFLVYKNWETILGSCIWPIVNEMESRNMTEEPSIALLEICSLMGEILSKFFQNVYSFHEESDKYLAGIISIVKKTRKISDIRTSLACIDIISKLCIDIVEKLDNPGWNQIVEYLIELLKEKTPKLEYDSFTKEMVFKDFKEKMMIRYTTLLLVSKILEMNSFGLELQRIHPLLLEINTHANSFNENMELRLSLHKDGFLHGSSNSGLQDLVLIKQEVLSMDCIIKLSFRILKKVLLCSFDNNNIEKLHQNITTFFECHMRVLGCFIEILKTRRAYSEEEKQNGIIQYEDKERFLYRWALTVEKTLQNISVIHEICTDKEEALKEHSLLKVLRNNFSETFDIAFIISNRTCEPGLVDWENGVYQEATNFVYECKRKWEKYERL
eukprot:GHVP01042540.1.p1 GENE.GHVP01042540.1~~GHVP01042540.1.p1  ORF type:complete len:1256 (+),score=215.57 GHVP01042540.1:1830-5597(+)